VVNEFDFNMNTTEMLPAQKPLKTQNVTTMHESDFTLNTTETLPALAQKPIKTQNVTTVRESDFEKGYENLYKNWNEFLLWQNRKKQIKLCEVCQTTGDLIKKGGRRFHELCYGYCRFIEVQSNRCTICMLIPKMYIFCMLKVKFDC
jgi:hypothetical protein